jgi:hypothetical protein
MNNPFRNPLDDFDQTEVAAAAKADALAGRPASEDTALPAGFQAASTKLKAHYDGGVEECQNELNALEEENDVLDARITPVNLEAQSEKIISEMVDTLEHSQTKAFVRFYKQEFNNKKENLQRFKLQHDLIYDPSRGTDKSPLPFGISVSAAVVTLLYIAESIFNGFMFIDSSGLFQGLSISLAASLVNVILGYIVGRYVITALFYHPTTLIKVLASIGTLLFAFVIVWLNLMIAAFRSMQEEAKRNFEFNINTGEAVWPFAHLELLDFTGALLVGVGIVFALSALMDGWFSDDPFPGYGRKYRACTKQKDQAEKYLVEYKQLFHSEVGAARNRMNDLYENASRSIDQWGRNINKIQQRFVDYVDWVESIKNAHNATWEAYVASHQAHRLDNYQAPETLSNEPSFFISEANQNPEHVFSDVAAHYMDDETRMKKMDAYRADYAKAHKEFLENLRVSIGKLKAELTDLESESECHI